MITVVIEDEKERRVQTKYTLALDPAKNPRVFKKTRQDGVEKGETEVGIYEFAGDNLHLCFKKAGGIPGDFVIERGPAQDKVLYVFQRGGSPP
jgi:uncharacterized protein (TIGR03067 family)